MRKIQCEETEQKTEVKARVRLVCVNCKRIDEYIKDDFDRKEALCTGCNSRALDVYVVAVNTDNRSPFNDALLWRQRNSEALYPTINTNVGVLANNMLVTGIADTSNSYYGHSIISSMREAMRERPELDTVSNLHSPRPDDFSQIAR